MTWPVMPGNGVLNESKDPGQHFILGADGTTLPMLSMTATDKRLWTEVLPMVSGV
jgi:hypothetical protein